MDKILNNDFEVNIYSIAETARNQFWSRKYNDKEGSVYTLNYFCEGSYEFLYADKSLIVSAPFIRIAHRGTLPYTTRAHIYPTRVISTFFTTNVPLPLKNDIAQSIVVPDNPEEAEHDFSKALRLYTENPQLNVLEYKGLILMLLGSYIKKLHIPSESKYPRFISDSLKYIDMHKDRTLNLNVKDIAEKFNVSYEYYVREFKKHVGISPKQYIIKIKMEYIKMLICKTDMSMAEIAFMTGFSDQTYFYNCFKSYYGTSPNKYREEHKKFK